MGEMDASRWQAARLIPVSGIRGEAEAEQRGCSALLAVLGSVKEFARAVLGPMGAPAGKVETFIEVSFDQDGFQFRPDGLIRVTRGQKCWVALVEVKTGPAKLRADQIDCYVNIARQHAFNVVWTISNEVAIAGEQPTPGVDRKRLKKVRLEHLSWPQIRTEALIEQSNRSVSDPDQAWILAELLRYFEHPNSGAMDFDDMGASWVHVRDKVVEGTLHRGDPAAGEVVDRFAQLVAFAAMSLARKLGVEVRAKQAGADRAAAVAELASAGRLKGILSVPHAAADLRIVADLRAKRLHCTATVSSPPKPHQVARVRWLVRQLENAPDEVVVETSVAYQKGPGPSAALSDLRVKPELLVPDRTKNIRSFTVGLSATAGSKRSGSRGSFATSVVALVEDFYKKVLQDIKPWTPPVPRTRPEVEDHAYIDAPAVVPDRQLSQQSTNDGGGEDEGLAVVDVGCGEPMETISDAVADSPVTG